MITIAWEAFTPIQSVAGGSLIGLAAALLVLLTGRIAGISGILGGFFSTALRDLSWRIAFVVGLVAAPWAYLMGVGASAPFESNSNLLLLCGAGLLVGVGTRLGSGCTSGHGVCGLSRLSVRSLVATVVFMLAGITVATFLRPFLV